MVAVSGSVLHLPGVPRITSGNRDLLATIEIVLGKLDLYLFGNYALDE